MERHEETKGRRDGREPGEDRPALKIAGGDEMSDPSSLAVVPTKLKPGKDGAEAA